MSPETIVYFVAITLWSAFVAYILLRGKKHTEHEVHHAPATHAAVGQITRTSGTFSAFDGFRSFATGPELTVEDIVKGLSRTKSGS